MSRRGQKQDDLTPLQETFKNNYADPDSDTFGNATKSYVKAGYKDSPAAMVSACNLLRNPKIVKAIEEDKKKRESQGLLRGDVTREKLIKRLDDQYAKATAKGDCASALRAIELQGKSIGMWVDKHINTTEHQIIMDETQRKEAQRLARLLIEDSLNDSDETPAWPVIDAESKDDTKTLLNDTDFWLEDNDQTGQDAAP